jgi:hypothetical protein
MPICVTDHVWAKVAAHCVVHNNATPAATYLMGIEGAGAGWQRRHFSPKLPVFDVRSPERLKSENETARVDSWCLEMLFPTHPEALIVQIAESSGLAVRWEKQTKLLMWNGIRLLRLFVRGKNASPSQNIHLQLQNSISQTISSNSLIQINLLVRAISLGMMQHSPASISWVIAIKDFHNTAARSVNQHNDSLAHGAARKWLLFH